MNYNIVIIGGNPSGGSVALAAKLFHKGKSVLVIRKEPESLIPCGIPYTFGTLDSVEENIKSIEPAKKQGIDFMIDEVMSIDSSSKSLSLKNNETVVYEKLIIATGSTPFVPPIEGNDLEGVVTIRKELDYIKRINKILKSGENIVVIGAGFIGLEMSDELIKVCKNVTLIESMDSILPLAFDADMITPVSDVLSKHGVTIRTNTMVDKIIGDGTAVRGVKLKNGEEITADRVILAIGYMPNNSLAKEAGIAIGIYGGIVTDEYLRTNVEDIYAVGDCAEHKDFFTQKESRLMLASTGAAEARIAAMNLYGIRVVRRTKGSAAIFSTSLEDISMGAAGLTESQALNEGFEIVTGSNMGVNHHPATLPNTLKQEVKLIFSKGTGVILGAQIIGGDSTGEMINILGLAIQKSMTAFDLAIMQYGTQPMLTAGPGNYPIVLAAMKAAAKLS